MMTAAAAAAGRAGRIEMRRCVIVGLINLIRQHFSLFKEVKNLDFLKVVVRSSFLLRGGRPVKYGRAIICWSRFLLYKIITFHCDVRCAAAVKNKTVTIPRRGPAAAAIASGPGEVVVSFSFVG
jgi:hypothetical protein